MPRTTTHRDVAGPSWVLFVLVLACAPTVWADATLDMDAAARLAVEQQPQLIAQQHGIDALRESAVAARQLPDPRLQVGLASLPLNTFSFTQEDMTQAVVGVSQMIPGGKKLEAAGRRLEVEAESAGQNLDASRRRIERDARLAWLDAYQAAATLKLLQDIQREYDRQVEWSTVAYKTGQMAQDETLALRVERENLLDRLTEQGGQKERAQANLRRWVGDAALRPLEPLANPQDPLSLAELEKRLEQHPELTAMSGQVGMAQAEAQMAREAFRPDWSVDLAYGLRNGGRTDLVSLVVGVELPVFTTNRQDRRLAARLAGMAQMEQNLADRRLAMQADLRAAYADWQAASARGKRYGQDILPMAKQRIDSALAAYGAGKAPFARVLEAKRSELENRLAWLNQQVALARAGVMLKYYGD